MYYEELLENLRIADAVHKAGTIHGFCPSASFDYTMIHAMMGFKLTGEDVNYGGRCSSLAFFYKNLGHILQGDWWIYSTPDSMEEFKRKVPQEYDVELNRVMQLHLQAITTILFLGDLHEDVASVLGEGRVTSEAIETMLGAESDVKNLGAKLPSEFFINYYCLKATDQDNSPEERQKHSTFTKAKVNQNLREFIEN